MLLSYRKESMVYRNPYICLNWDTHNLRVIAELIVHVVFEARKLNWFLCPMTYGIRWFRIGFIICMYLRSHERGLYQRGVCNARAFIYKAMRCIIVRSQKVSRLGVITIISLSNLWLAHSTTETLANLHSNQKMQNFNLVGSRLHEILR